MEHVFLTFHFTLVSINAGMASLRGRDCTGKATKTKHRSFTAHPEGEGFTKQAAVYWCIQNLI